MGFEPGETACKPNALTTRLRRLHEVLLSPIPRDYESLANAKLRLFKLIVDTWCLLRTGQMDVHFVNTISKSRVFLSVVFWRICE